MAGHETVASQRSAVALTAQFSDGEVEIGFDEEAASGRARSA
jgi:hypothetical protein